VGGGHWEARHVDLLYKHMVCDVCWICMGLNE
jgi:hypothetical protein